MRNECLDGARMFLLLLLVVRRYDTLLLRWLGVLVVGKQFASTLARTFFYRRSHAFSFVLHVPPFAFLQRY